MKRKYILTSIFAAAFLTATPLLAHSKKEATSPANGAILTDAPEAIEMNFDNPIRLTLFRLTDAGGSEFDVQRTDEMAPVTEFKAVPPSLLPGSYTVDWRGLSSDGHPMQGSFSFQIAD